jgi:hypothetical protein
MYYAKSIRANTGQQATNAALLPSMWSANKINRPPTPKKPTAKRLNPKSEPFPDLKAARPQPSRLQCFIAIIITNHENDYH